MEEGTKGWVKNNFLCKPLLYIRKWFIPINFRLFATCILGHWQNGDIVEVPLFLSLSLIFCKNVSFGGFFLTLIQFPGVQPTLPGADKEQAALLE